MSRKICHVYHILVKYEYEAQDILKKIKTFDDFKVMAKKYSHCSSSQSGGDLGEVLLEKLNEDFADAVLLLNPGQMSIKPIRTSFGYHLIYRLK